MVTVTVTFDIEVPDVGATDAQIEDWVRFGVHETSFISLKNPLHSHELEAVFGSVDIQ